MIDSITDGWQTLITGPAAATEGRGLVRSVLDRWGHAAIAADAELVASEIVANASRHGRGPVRLRVSDCGDWVRIEVADSSPDLPEHHDDRGLSAKGWGLVLVDSVASRWGVAEIDGEGKIVWADLHL